MLKLFHYTIISQHCVKVEVFASQSGHVTVVNCWLLFQKIKVKEVFEFGFYLLPAEKALGVLWCVDSNMFKFKINLKERPVTR